jgi:hypothetical protein
MTRFKVVLACVTVAAASAIPATAVAGPPEHCYSPEFGDPCKPFYVVCQAVEDRTKGIVTCGD